MAFMKWNVAKEGDQHAQACKPCAQSLHALENPRTQMLGNKKKWLKVAFLEQSSWASSIIWQNSCL